MSTAKLQRQRMPKKEDSLVMSGHSLSPNVILPTFADRQTVLARCGCPYLAQQFTTAQITDTDTGKEHGDAAFGNDGSTKCDAVFRETVKPFPIP